MVALMDEQGLAAPQKTSTLCSQSRSLGGEEAKKEEWLFPHTQGFTGVSLSLAWVRTSTVAFRKCYASLTAGPVTTLFPSLTFTSVCVSVSMGVGTPHTARLFESSS